MKQLKIKIQNGVLKYQTIVDVDDYFLKQLIAEKGNQNLESRKATNALYQLVDSIRKVTRISTNDLIEVEESNEDNYAPSTYKASICLRDSNYTIEDLDHYEQEFAEFFV